MIYHSLEKCAIESSSVLRIVVFITLEIQVFKLHQISGKQKGAIRMKTRNPKTAAHYKILENKQEI